MCNIECVFLSVDQKFCSAFQADLFNTYDCKEEVIITVCELLGDKMEMENQLKQCVSTFVRPRPGKFFFYKTRARSQQMNS